MPVTTVRVSSLKDRAAELASFLGSKLHTTAHAEGDTIKLSTENPPSTTLVRTYVKRFLHREGLRKDYLLRVDDQELRILRVPAGEETAPS